MDILKFVEALPDSIKNIVISALLNSSIAMKNVEQDVRTVEQLPSYQGQGQQRFKKQSRMSLLESMKQGEYNAQYVDYFYEVLKKADDLVLNSTPQQLQLLAEKYGMGDHAAARYNFLHESQKQIHGNKSPQEIRREEYSRRVTGDDNYPVERIVTNRKNMKNVLDHAMGGSAQYSYSISVQRMYQTKNAIEIVTELLHVKEMGSQHRLIEFYIPKKYGVKQLQHTNPNIYQEMISIQGVSFNDDYGQPSDYKITGFYKMSENGMYDVVKFKGHKIEQIGFLR